MTDIMPERVQAYASVFGTYSLEKEGYHDIPCVLVPERKLEEAQKALDALRLDQADRESAWRFEVRGYESFISALRAERDALVPLATLGVATKDRVCYGVDTGEDDLAFADAIFLLCFRLRYGEYEAARAVLDRWHGMDTIVG